MEACIPQDVEELIVRHRKGRQRVHRIVGIVCAVLAGVTFAFAPGIRDGQIRRALYLFGGMLGIFMVIGIADSLRDPRKLRALKTLRTRAHEVVWAYLQTGQHGGVWLGLTDRKRVRIADADESILRSLMPAIPRATIGYHPDHERRFLVDPMSLRRA